jgi:hypothetical protein
LSVWRAEGGERLVAAVFELEIRLGSPPSAASRRAAERDRLVSLRICTQQLCAHLLSFGEREGLRRRDDGRTVVCSL